MGWKGDLGKDVAASSTAGSWTHRESKNASEVHPKCIGHASKLHKKCISNAF